ncbi:MAG: ligase-associated DNA damage response exonuclease [Planctomycetota bacterium]
MPPGSPTVTRLIETTDRGLYCAAGGFYIDPWRPVDRAVVTHAHSDHASPGSKSYLSSQEGMGVLRRRLPEDARIETLAYGQATVIGDARVSLHPAGHLLGSAQVRVEAKFDGRTRIEVVSGDYKLDGQHASASGSDSAVTSGGTTGGDPTCTPWEPVACDRFITESTFGLPIYRWPPADRVFADMNHWWADNQKLGRTSVVFAYALGKAQRVLAGLDASLGPIVAHGSVRKLSEAYHEAGRALPDTILATDRPAKELKGKAMVVAPPSVLGTTWLRRFAPYATAFASGWMQVRGNRRRRGVDRGFVISDHADWPGLLEAVRLTGAQSVGATHGYTAVLARYLREQGLHADEIPTRFRGEADDTPADTSSDTPTILSAADKPAESVEPSA